MNPFVSISANNSLRRFFQEPLIFLLNEPAEQRHYELCGPVVGQNVWLQGFLSDIRWKYFSCASGSLTENILVCGGSR